MYQIKFAMRKKAIADQRQRHNIGYLIFCRKYKKNLKKRELN